MAVVADSEAAAPREAGDMKPTSLLNPEERERIEAAVREAETGTSGEIVVSIVGATSRHSVAPWRLGVLLAALALFVSAYLPFENTLSVVFGLQVAALLAAHALVRVPSIRRAFLTEAELQAKADAGALRDFHALGIRRTEGRTGILIFVALFEHRVVVLGDEAIDHALGEGESWEGVVDLVLDGIREGRAADGIVSAVLRCGKMLSHPLPPSEDNPDEIPQGLILSD